MLVWAQLAVDREQHEQASDRRQDRMAPDVSRLSSLGRTGRLRVALPWVKAAQRKLIFVSAVNNAWLMDSSRVTIRDVRKADITVELVSRLVESQFPEWAGWPVRPVDVGGWDNATFRLGETMSVRLPSGEQYVEAVEKEQRWLPVLAGQLPLPIPEPVAVGRPGCGFPWPWSVCRWIDGAPATDENVADLPVFAADLADFLAALYRVDPTSGPTPGTHNFFRGGPLTAYDSETQDELEKLKGQIDTALAAEVWQAALGAAWQGHPVWFHGDAQPGNLLLDEATPRSPGRSCRGRAAESSRSGCRWTRAPGSADGAGRSGRP